MGVECHALSRRFLQTRFLWEWVGAGQESPGEVSVGMRDPRQWPWD